MQLLNAAEFDGVVDELKSGFFKRLFSAKVIRILLGDTETGIFQVANQCKSNKDFAEEH